MSTIVATSLEDKLKEKQRQEGLSDHKFAKKLSISYQLWNFIRTGKRQIPRSPIFRGIGQAYPELAPDVLIFLGFDVEIIPSTDDNLTVPYQTHQGKQQGGLRGLAKRLYLRLSSPNRAKPTKSKTGG